MAKLEEIEGIGQVQAKKLAKAGIKKVEDLLEKGATPKGRQELADTTTISDKQILRWVNMADLFRVKGVGQEYADLLEAAGVDTVKELAQRKAQNLHAKMAEVNEQKKLVRAVPALSQVEKWIAQAKELPRVVTH